MGGARRRYSARETPLKLLDVNVLLAAHRDDHAQFEIARPWLANLLRSGERFCITDLAAGSFVRLATNRRIFWPPTPLADAFALLRRLRGHPTHVRLSPGPDHLEIFEHLCIGADAVGDLAPDAQLAAIAVANGAEIVSFDRDFARFETVRWSRPAVTP